MFCSLETEAIINCQIANSNANIFKIMTLRSYIPLIRQHNVCLLFFFSIINSLGLFLAPISNVDI